MIVVERLVQDAVLGRRPSMSGQQPNGAAVVARMPVVRIAVVAERVRRIRVDGQPRLGDEEAALLRLCGSADNRSWARTILYSAGLEGEGRPPFDSYGPVETVGDLTAVAAFHALHFWTL